MAIIYLSRSLSLSLCYHDREADASFWLWNGWMERGRIGCVREKYKGMEWNTINGGGNG